VIFRIALLMGMILFCLMMACSSTEQTRQPKEFSSQPEAGPPRILSAFFGLDETLPWRIAFICLNGPEKDRRRPVFECFQYTHKGEGIYGHCDRPPRQPQSRDGSYGSEVVSVKGI